MAILIKNIRASILEHIVADVNTLNIVSIVGTDDYFKVFGLEGYIQNMTKVKETENYVTQNKFGLIRNNNEEFVKLEISY